jgi:soluble lytic murein transglycosylase
LASPARPAVSRFWQSSPSARAPTLRAADIKYNVQLGSHYIKKLIDRFEGSEMLAIASYNAGPNATQRWINEFYDPRQEKDIDRVVDWIELITYSETRNYVQRIMENLIVYKYLMSRSNYDVVR